MTRSTNMEHVEVLRELRDIARAAIGAGDWRVDGACDPDAALRRADAAIAALSAPKPEGEWVLVPRVPAPKMVGAWTMTAGSFTDAYAAMLAAAPQPPAEAQPVAVPTVIVQQGTRVALVDGKPGYERIRCYWELPEGAELFLRPPPSAPVRCFTEEIGRDGNPTGYLLSGQSAPVGVEGLPPDVQEIVRKDDAAWALAERAEAAGAERDSDDDGAWWTLRIEHFKALAQPATPDSDKAMKWHAWRLTRLRDQLRNGLRPDELKAFDAALAALAQQAAAAGELVELVGLLDEVRSHFTRDDDLPDDLLPRIDAALAQQPIADPLVEWANSPLNFTATVGVFKDGVQPAAGAGQWVRCTPELLSSGVSCAKTPRRPGDGHSHDHFIAHTPEQPAAVDGAQISEAMVERAMSAYLRRQDDGESLYGCVTAALTAALAAQPGGVGNE